MYNSFFFFFYYSHSCLPFLLPLYFPSFLFGSSFLHVLAFRINILAIFTNLAGVFSFTGTNDEATLLNIRCTTTNLSTNFSKQKEQIIFSGLSLLQEHFFNHLLSMNRRLGEIQCFICIFDTPVPNFRNIKNLYFFQTFFSKTNIFLRKC
jgi:hypothetical protein